MKYSDCVEVFESREKQKIEELCKRIIDLGNMSELKVLCEHIDFFRVSIKGLETHDSLHYKTNMEYFWAHIALRLLEAINAGRCRCYIYSYIKAKPRQEEKMGLTTVVSSKFAETKNIHFYTSQCNICGNKYSSELERYRDTYSKWAYITEI